MGAAGQDAECGRKSQIGNATASGSASETGTGYLLGLGYEYGFSPNLGARLGYTRYENLGGQSNNKANLFSLGLKYKF